MAKKFKANIVATESANRLDLCQESEPDQNDIASGVALSDMRSTWSEKDYRFILVVGAVCFLVFMAIAPMCSGPTKPRPVNIEMTRLRAAERILKASLNYPDSYSLQGWRVDGNEVTLEYKAKNAFGMERTERTVITVD